MMHIWKLTPVDSSDPTWTGYDTRPMFVRAESAREAQERAELATVQFVSTTEGYLQSNPWRDYRTRCGDVTNTSGHSVDGPAEVLTVC
jgi:hypothetical protein